MKRLKSIDIFRGLCMFYMVVGHSLDWWIRAEDYWFFYVYVSIGGPVGASGFLFIAGISTALSYRNRCLKAEADNSDLYSMRLARNEYMWRAFLIFWLFV